MLDKKCKRVYYINKQNENKEVSSSNLPTMASDHTIKSLEINSKRNGMKSQARIRIAKIELNDLLFLQKSYLTRNIKNCQHSETILFSY